MDPLALLCPQVTVHEEDTPLQLDISSSELNGDNNAEETDLNNLPDELKIRILMDGYEFDKDQKPIDLTIEEKAQYYKFFMNGQTVEYFKIHCTSCQKHLGSNPVKQFNRFVHPILQVLLCKKCFLFYNSGEYVKDEDGSELYCRWCGEGGKVLCCSSCQYVFCSKCIKNNVGTAALDDIKNRDDWKCFVCNPKQIETLRFICFGLFHYISNIIRVAKETKNLQILKVDNCTCCPKVPKGKRKRAHKSDDENEDETYRPQKQTGTPAMKKPLLKNKAIVTNILKTLTNSSPTTTAVSSQNPVPQMRKIILPSKAKISSITVLPNPPPLYKLTPPSALNPPNTNNNPRINNDEWFLKNVKSAQGVASVLLKEMFKLQTEFLTNSEANVTQRNANFHNQLQFIFTNAMDSLKKVGKKVRDDFIESVKKQNMRVVYKRLAATKVGPPKVRSEASGKPVTIDLAAEESEKVVATPAKDPLEIPTSNLEVPTKAVVHVRKVDADVEHLIEIDAYNSVMKKAHGPLSVRRAAYERNYKKAVDKYRKMRISKNIKLVLSEDDFMSALNVRVKLSSGVKKTVDKTKTATTTALNSVTEKSDVQIPVDIDEENAFLYSLDINK